MPFFSNPRRRLERLLTWRGNPWHVARFEAGHLSEAHRIASRHTLVGRLGCWAWWLKLLLTLAWPIRLAYQARPLLRHYSAAVRERHGRSLAGQIADIGRLGLGYGVSPISYYQLRLFLPENRNRLADYLYDHEAGPLFQYLNGFRKDPAVEDKRLFAERCAAAGLPVATTLAWWDESGLRSANEDWPAGDLVSKPVTGCRGEGVSIWSAQGTAYRGAGGLPSFSRAELLRHLTEAGAGKPGLLQPALANHAVIADLSTGPALTARVMTAMDRHGVGEVFAALLKIPVGRQRISNHGLGSAIDLERGTLGPAYSYRPLHPEYHRHPNTGAAITGRILPDWEATTRLVLAAHALFPDMRFLGWDVLLTPDGPVLLETNSGWDVAMPQIALQRPLGKTRFAALCGGMLGER